MRRLRDDGIRKELIIPDSGDGNSTGHWSSRQALDEGIDNPRLRGRKPNISTENVFKIKKELIIPDSGDGNQRCASHASHESMKELIIPDSGDGNTLATIAM